MVDQGPNAKNVMRLQKYMSLKNMCSRRQAEEWIVEGRVSVNGQKVQTLGVKINAKKDKVTVSKPNVEMHYLAVYKPRGVLTHKNTESDSCVLDLIENFPKAMVPIGRLDKESEGLILLSNDRVFCKKCLDPNRHIEKTYWVQLDKPLIDKHIQQLKKGLVLKGELLKSILVRQLRDPHMYEFKMTQGKNRQIRRLMSKFRREVLMLKRVAFGRITLKDLKSGEAKEISPKQLFL